MCRANKPRYTITTPALVGHWPDEDIADHLDTSRMTVMRVRQQFAADGLEATVHREKPTGR